MKTEEITRIVRDDGRLVVARPGHGQTSADLADLADLADTR
jgi:hypothetical protein